ncbi:hypothetical protein BDQ12DRAFT_665975 [Crucibulum laeve]|uniref:Uncharacterized protein n=1 Tax=Crucibulum laeve TaxID=68775 RepID=A0A5C3M040_9AGAR|nr:hypothetical protein BDQ12DRAFT_665975 [Crucibulum laeve]
MCDLNLRSAISCLPNQRVGWVKRRTKTETEPCKNLQSRACRFQSDDHAYECDETAVVPEASGFKPQHASVERQLILSNGTISRRRPQQTRVKREQITFKPALRGRLPNCTETREDGAHEGTQEKKSSSWKRKKRSWEIILGRDAIRADIDWNGP